MKLSKSAHTPFYASIDHTFVVLHSSFRYYDQPNSAQAFEEAVSQNTIGDTLRKKGLSDVEVQGKAPEFLGDHPESFDQFKKQIVRE